MEKRSIIIGIVVIACVVAAIVAYTALQGKGKVIETTDEPLCAVEELKQAHIKMNTTILVSNGTMMEMNLYNLNEGRNMNCEIYVNDERIYVSPILHPGEVLRSDSIAARKLSGEETEAYAYIYTYDSDGDVMANVKLAITMIKQ